MPESAPEVLPPGDSGTAASADGSEAASSRPLSASAQSDLARSAKVRAARIHEYSRLALQADALAEGSVLANVRDKHQGAADRWRSLAILTAAPVTKVRK